MAIRYNVIITILESWIPMTDTCYIYVLLTQTPTKFGALVRNVTKTEYNHASIAFDESLQQIYSFGRIFHHAPVIAGIVREYIERFTLLSSDYVKIRIIRVPVSTESYQTGLALIREIEEDRKYFYNLLSVLSYPLLRGFYTHKAFSCAEFTAFMLRRMNVRLNTSSPDWAITPMEIAGALEYPIIFEGNLLDSLCPVHAHGTPEELACYFSPIPFSAILGRSTAIIFRLLFRKLRFFRPIG